MLSKYLRLSDTCPTLRGRGWGEAGTTGASIGTTALVENRSNKFCRRMRYSSSLLHGKGKLSTPIGTQNTHVRSPSEFATDSSFNRCANVALYASSMSFIPGAHRPFLRDSIRIFPRRRGHTRRLRMLGVSRGSRCILDARRGRAFGSGMIHLFL